MSNRYASELREGLEAVTHFEFLLRTEQLDGQRDGPRIAALRDLLNLCNALAKDDAKQVG